MLDAGRAPEQIEGLTVFFDHADDHRRYVMWDVPQTAARPDPQLSLLLYRGSESGGLLQCEVTLAPPLDRLTAAEERLTREGRKPILVRPDWRSGRVSVAGWLQAAELAPTMLAIGTPSLVGDPVAVIAARLDAHGAALADAAIKGDALPTAVIFELETLGLAGPLGVEAEADLEALHDRLTAQGALTTPIGRARIAKTWEEAARDNVIRVRVIDESGDVESQRAEAMRRVGEDLIARMFSPFPPPELGPQLPDRPVAAVELSFRLTMRSEEIETTQRWDFRERRARAITHHAAASLIGMLGGRDPHRHIAFADLTERPRTAVVRVEPELAALAMIAVEVDLHENGTATAQQTITLTDDAPERRVSRRDPDAALRYRVRARFDPLRTSAPDAETAWLDAIGGLIAVSPRRLFAPRLFSVIVGRAELDWLDHVEVLVTARDEAPRSVLLGRDRHSGDVFFPGGGRELSVTAHWRGLPGEPSRSERRAVRDDLLILDSPFADSINVLIVPLPRADVRSCIVDLTTSHGEFAHTKTVTWDAPDRAPRRAGLRRLVDSPRRYSYRAQLILDDGTIEQKAWTDTDAAVLTIGADGPVDVRTAEVVLIGGGPSARDSFAIELALECGDARTVEVIDGQRNSVALAIVLPPSGGAVTLIAREFLNSGDVRETRWVDPPALTVIAPAITPIP